MAHTQYRNPIRPARGTKTALLANLDRLTQWEIVYATDENKLYTYNGTTLVEAGVISLNNMSNVNDTGIADGSLLVYNATTQEWEANADTTTEEIVNGGNF